MKRMDEFNHALNDYFDNRIDFDRLYKVAQKTGHEKHELIQQIFTRNEKEALVSFADVEQLKQILKEKNISPKGLSDQRIKELVTQILTCDALASIPSDPNESRFGRFSKQGLPNLRNTCFLNSSLQSLMEFKGIKDLLEADLNKRDHESENTFMDRVKLKNTLSLLFEQVKLETPDRDLIIELLEQISVSPLFSRLKIRKHEEDAQEFLTLLFDALEINESERSSIQIKTLNAEDDRIVNNESKNMPIVHLPENLDPCSLNELIAEEFKEQIIDRGQRGNMQTKYQFSHPDVSKLENIAINIARYKADEKQGFIKPSFTINDPLSPIQLPIFDEKTGSQKLVSFKPQSIIIHYGSSPKSGHYTCIKKEGDNFVEFSDSFKRTLRREEAIDLAGRNGYIFNFEVESF